MAPQKLKSAEKCENTAKRESVLANEVMQHGAPPDWHVSAFDFPWVGAFLSLSAWSKQMEK